jgi:hypothetical protein
MLRFQVVWEKYIEAMKLAGFDSTQGLYIASGLLTYGASDGEIWHPWKRHKIYENEMLGRSLLTAQDL